MKIYFLFLLLFLASCSPPAQPVATLVPTSTAQPAPTPTSTRIPATATIPPTIAPTSIPTPCDPFIAEYCITDGHFVLQRPIQPPYTAAVDGTYRYASTANGTRDPHHGVEMGESYGTPVHAAAEGVVVFADPDTEAVYGPWKNFYGNMVVIRHADDLFTLYAHLSAIDVTAGDTVRVGGKIGEVGQTGAATGSHLHFEVRQGDAEDYFATVNPELWLVPAQAEHGAISLSILDDAARFQRAELTLQHYSDTGEVIGIYYLKTYHPTLATGSENAALGDLPAGRYRLALIHNGHLYERRVEVQSGKLTQVVIVIMLF